MALIEAMRIAKGKKSDAAKLLGLSRQHLHRLLPPPDPSVTSGDSVTRGDARDAHVSRGGVTTHAVDTPTLGASLTYGRYVPTVGSMSTAAVATEARTEADPVSRVAFDLRRHHTDWLDEKALRRKRERGESRPSKSRILADLLDEAMAKEQPRAPAPRKNGKGGKKKGGGA